MRKCISEALIGFFYNLKHLSKLPCIPLLLILTSIKKRAIEIQYPISWRGHKNPLLHTITPGISRHAALTGVTIVMNNPQLAALGVIDPWLRPVFVRRLYDDSHDYNQRNMSHDLSKLLVPLLSSWRGRMQDGAAIQYSRPSSITAWFQKPAFFKTVWVFLGGARSNSQCKHLSTYLPNLTTTGKDHNELIPFSTHQKFRLFFSVH